MWWKRVVSGDCFPAIFLPGKPFTIIIAAGIKEGFGKRFWISSVDQTLWPVFLDLSEALVSHLDEITTRIIQQAVYSDSSEAEEREMLPG